MGYERTLLTRWTRRDWLAIAVIALTTTFLIGTSIMILAAGSQIEGEVQRLDALETAEFTDDPDVTGSGESTLPVAQATTANGSAVTVIGLPETTVNLTSSFGDATLSNPPPGGVVERGAPTRSTVRLAGATGNATLAVREASNRSVLPDRWYTAGQETVRELGRTGRFQLETDAVTNATNTSGLPDEGTLLSGTPGFLVTGGGEIVELLGWVTLASGLLIGVTVYSVTRMTVRDRRRTLFVVRSTGGTRRRLIGIFGVRAALLTAVGAAFGYALGIILINAILNVATYYGTLTTLDVSGSPTDRLVVGAMLVAIVAIGLVAGALSVIRTAAASPASLMATGAGVTGADGFAGRAWEALGVDVIGRRTVVPMAAALTVLIAIAVVSVSVGLTLAPLAGATDGVIMSPDAGYPLQSEVDEDLVRSFRAAGITASPEVLLPQVRDGQPYLMRGVNYSVYRQVSDVSMTAGREPAAIDEALIGEGLAGTLDVGVNDTITVGGGTAFGIDHVTVVGRFDGEGYLDDQLLVSIGAAKQLANMEDDSVQIIRTTGVEERPDPGNETPMPADIVVTNASVPDVSIVNRPVPVEVTVENRGDVAGNRTLTVPVNGTERNTTVSLDGEETRTVTLSARFQAAGVYTISVGVLDTQVEIVEPKPADIVVTGLVVPERGVVNETVPVDVTLENRGDVAGNRTLTVPVNGTERNTTVSVGGGERRAVTLTASFLSAGDYTLTVGDLNASVTVDPAEADIVVTSLTVPEKGIVNRSVPVNVTLRNRGGQPGTRTLRVPGSGTERERTVVVRGNQERAVTLDARFNATGTYDLSVGNVTRQVEIVEPSPADIILTGLSVPDTGVVNQSVPVEVTLKNRGDLAGNRTLTVPVNGTERNTTMTVGGRQTRTVTLSARFQSEGAYTITVGGRDADVKIVGLSPADVVVTDVSVPETALINASVPIDVTLENRGGRTGNRTLNVPVNGSDQETTVTIEGGQTRTISLSARFQSTGEYNLTVGEVDAAVEIVDPPQADVVVTDVDAPETAFVEDDIILTATVENRGDRVGNVTLTTPVDGAESDTNVTVESGEERVVTLVASYETEGTYELTVGDVVSEIRIIGTDPPDVVVRNVSAPPLWRVDAGIPIEVTVENRGDLPGDLTLGVPVNGSTRETTVAVNRSGNRTVTLNGSFRTPGKYSLTVAGEDTRIRIVRPANISLSPLPTRAPPNATLLVTARNRTDSAVSGLQFRLGQQRTRTGPNGTARIRVPSNPGEYQLESVIGEQVVHNRRLEVGTELGRSVIATLRVRPEQVTFRGDTEAIVTAYNPWGTALRQELLIKREGESVFSRTIELAPGEETTVTTSIDPAPTDSTQRVQLVSDGAVLGEATFTIDISDRALATLARLGLYQSGSGLTRSLDSLLGNFQVLQGALLVLSFLVGIGSTATVVIQATHARRRTIGIQRVTGASPRDIVGTLLSDGLRVGAIASAMGVVSAYAGLTLLVEVGYAVVFGVRIPPLLDPWLVLGVFGGALAVVAASSVIAAWWVLRVSPGALVTASTQRVPDQDDSQPTPQAEVEG